MTERSQKVRIDNAVAELDHIADLLDGRSEVYSLKRG